MEDRRDDNYNPEVLEMLRSNSTWLSLNTAPNTAEKIISFLNNTYIPVVVALGLLGNTLSFVAFFCTHLKFRSSSYYLGCLAVSDFGFLVMLICVWLDGKGVEVMSQNGPCQLVAYLSTAFSCWSTWLTVCFTAERFVAVNFPFWRLHLCKTQRAKIVCAISGFFSFGLNLHYFFLTGVVEKVKGLFLCDIYPQYWRASHYINILDTLLTLVVPLIAIIFMNFMIARAIVAFSDRQANPSRADSGPSMSSTMEQTPDDSNASNNSRQGGLSLSSQMSISRTLLVVSTVFVVLNLPSYTTRLYLLILENYMDPSDQSNVVTAHRYFMLLYYTNFAVNFLLYNVGSRVFRRALKAYLNKNLATIRSLIKSRPTVSEENYS